MSRAEAGDTSFAIMGDARGIASHVWRAAGCAVRYPTIVKRSLAQTPSQSLADRIVRVVPTLPTQALRMAWLRDALSTASPSASAAALEVLCDGSDRGDPACREVLVSLAGMLQDPGSRHVLDLLRSTVSADSVTPLARMVHGGLSISRGTKRPRAPGSDDERRIPDYGRGRPLTLGERKALARRPTRKLLDRLLADPHPQVIRNVLDNPITTEDDVVRIAARRPLPPTVMLEIARHPRWNVRTRVRMAMLLNPGCPAEVGVPLVSLLSLADLRVIADMTDIHESIQHAVVERLRRPVAVAEPVRAPEDGDLN
jgi:hypothetical protein